MSSTSESTSSSATSTSNGKESGKTSKKPTCLIVIGMAGAGKTSFLKSLNTHLHTRKKVPYTINLDPACMETSFPCNIDIKDTINYKEVMKQYSLGPNGAIITSLNLFSTKFDQVLGLVEKRASELDYVLIDTPGQIEVFTWSASGSVITESLASMFPTVIVYVMDTSRNVNPVTFMSNMLYACSILYKSKLPFVIVMNKNDIIHHSYVSEWVTNFETFQDALESETSYMSNLTRSLSLVLDEFYNNIKFVGVSSLTMSGLDDFLTATDVCREEYQTDYLAEYEKLVKKKEKKEREEQEKHLAQFKKDLSKSEVLETAAKSEENDEERRRRAQAAHDDEDQESNIEFESFKRFLENPNTEKN